MPIAQRISILMVLCLLGLIPASKVEGQVLEILDFKKRKILGDSLIQSLKEGVLVVRLRTYEKNLKAIEKSLASEGLSKRQKQMLEEKRQSLLVERDTFNQDMIQAFNEHYTFSNFLVMHDTASWQLRKGITSGYFLDDSLRIDPNIDLGEQNYFVFRQGFRRDASGSSARGFIVYTQEGEETQNPFPSFIKTRSLGKSMAGLFKNKNNDGRKAASSIVTKLNHKLTKYHGKALAREQEREQMRLKREAEKAEKEAKKAAEATENGG